MKALGGFAPAATDICEGVRTDPGPPREEVLTGAEIGERSALHVQDEERRAVEIHARRDRGLADEQVALVRRPRQQLERVAAPRQRGRAGIAAAVDLTRAAT